MRRLVFSLALALLLLASPAWADITSNLTGWYKFDDGAGSTAVDSSASANDGTLGGTPTWVAGHVGTHALSFASATSDTVSLGDIAGLSPGTGDFTVALFFNPSVLDGTTRQIYKNLGAASIPDVQLNVNAANGVTFFVRDDAANAISAASTTTLSTSTWYCLVGVLSSHGGGNGTVNIYVNAVSEANQTGTLNTVTLNDGALLPFFGSVNDASQFVDGIIDEARLFQRGLASGDVTEFCNLASAGAPVRHRVIQQ